MVVKQLFESGEGIYFICILLILSACSSAQQQQNGIDDLQQQQQQPISISFTSDSLQTQNGQIQQTVQDALREVSLPGQDTSSIITTLATQLAPVAVVSVQASQDSADPVQEISGAVRQALEVAAAQLGATIGDLDVDRIVERIQSRITPIFRTSDRNENIALQTEQVVEIVLEEVGDALGDVASEPFTTDVSVTSQVVTSQNNTNQQQQQINIRSPSQLISGIQLQDLDVQSTLDYVRSQAMENEVSEISLAFVWSFFNNAEERFSNVLTVIFIDNSFPFGPVVEALGQTFSALGENVRALVAEAFEKTIELGDTKQLAEIIILALTSGKNEQIELFSGALDDVAATLGCQAINRLLIQLISSNASQQVVEQTNQREYIQECIKSLTVNLGNSEQAAIEIFNLLVGNQTEVVVNSFLRALEESQENQVVETLKALFGIQGIQNTTIQLSVILADFIQSVGEEANSLVASAIEQSSQIQQQRSSNILQSVLIQGILDAPDIISQVFVNIFSDFIRFEGDCSGLDATIQSLLAPQQSQQALLQIFQGDQYLQTCLGPFLSPPPILVEFPPPPPPLLSPIVVPVSTPLPPPPPPPSPLPQIALVQLPSPVVPSPVVPPPVSPSPELTEDEFPLQIYSVVEPSFRWNRGGERILIGQCYDITPSGGLSCQQQAQLGKCERRWMLRGLLCASTCGYCESQCIDIEPDKNTTCLQVLSNGECNSDKIIDNNFCRKTCNLCDLEPAVVQTIPSPTPSPSPTPIPSPIPARTPMPTFSFRFSDDGTTRIMIGGCFDIPTSDGLTCEQQREFGKCARQWMRAGTLCASTCGICESECIDIQPDASTTCQQHVQNGNCAEVAANGFCLKSCNLCGVTQPSQQQPLQDQQFSAIVSAQNGPKDSSEFSFRFSDDGRTRILIGGCFDVVPDGSYTCAQQSEFGKCTSAWMISGNLCASTCGLCTSQCIDIQPDTETTCAQHKANGNCATITSQGFCKRTCDACENQQILKNQEQQLELSFKWSEDGRTRVLIGGCFDIQPPSGGLTCAQSQQFGKCDRSWMRDGNLCADTCGYCTSQCMDILPDEDMSCQVYVQQGRCLENEENTLCRKSCGFCQ